MTTEIPSKNKQSALNSLLTSLNIHNDDIIEKFVTGSGKGGQKQNKVQNCAFIKHIPTGIQVKCQKSRSKVLNLFLAKRRLCEKIQEAQGIKTTTQLKHEKIRKQKKRRYRKNKQN